MTAPTTKTAKAPKAIPSIRGRCPECLVALGSKDPRKVFCSPAHKTAFHNRQAKRGQVSNPLLQAWRAGRGSSPVSKWAYKELAALADRWNAEDHAAGRANAEAYASLKFRAGWKAVDL